MLWNFSWLSPRFYFQAVTQLMSAILVNNLFCPLKTVWQLKDFLTGLFLVLSIFEWNWFPKGCSMNVALYWIESIHRCFRRWFRMRLQVCSCVTANSLEPNIALDYKSQSTQVLFKDAYFNYINYSKKTSEFPKFLKFHQLRFTLWIQVCS